MIGLSKKDKEEILEFPKTYGVILHGMHQDLSELRKEVLLYKSQAQNLEAEKILFLSRIEKEKFKLESLLQKTQAEFANVKSEIQLQKNSIEKMHDLIVQRHRLINNIIEGTEAKLKENENSIQRILKTISASLISNKENQDLLEERTNQLTNILDRVEKRTQKNGLILWVLSTLTIVSLILHWI